MLSESQIQILQHTIGVRQDSREPYRNHFLASVGHHDYADLQALENSGLMKRVPSPSFCRADDITFVCTESGKSVAIDNLPAPKKRTKYEEYLRAEVCESFAEWLGITPPVLEYGILYSTRGMVRYARRSYLTSGIEVVAGEFKYSKIEAKASYKAALKLHNANKAGSKGDL